MIKFFAEKSSYYAKYRQGYPKEMFETIVSQFDLTSRSEILDLGCGTGNIAIPLAKRGFCVHAIDPDSEMIAEGKQVEEKELLQCPITWMIGSDNTVRDMGLPQLQLCTMGLSFHWMNQDALLCILDEMIEQGGGIACINRSDCFSLYPIHTKKWSNIVNQVIQEMMGESWDYSGRTGIRHGERHEVIFSRSSFPVLKEYTYCVHENLSIDEIIGLLLSHSYVHPVLLRERNQDLRNRITERLLAHEPSGRFVNEATIQLLVAKRE